MPNPVAIVDYVTLQDAVARYLEQEDVEANDIPLFVSLAESSFDQDIRVRDMVALLAATQTGGGPIPLPDDFIEILTFTGPTSPKYLAEVTSPQVLTELEESGSVVTHVAVIGADLHTRGVYGEDFTYELSYYQKVPRLADVSVNWLVTRFPEIYLHATLREAWLYYLDDTRSENANARVVRGITSMHAADMRARYRPQGRRRATGQMNDGRWRIA